MVHVLLPEVKLAGAHAPLLRGRAARARAGHTLAPEYFSGRRRGAAGACGASAMAEPHSVLNALPLPAAREALARCCGACSAGSRPCWRAGLPTTPQLLAASDAVTATLTRADHLEAFSHHLKSARIPSSAQVRKHRRLNRGRVPARAASTCERSKRCATKTAPTHSASATSSSCARRARPQKMLGLLEQRFLGNDPDVELRIAAGEQAKIAKLRLEKIA